MTRSVDEVNITNFTDTGLTTAMARYTFTLEVKWTDDSGVAHTNGPTLHTFPNELSTMPLAARRYFAQEMIKAVIRVSLGIDDWSQYS